MEISIGLLSVLITLAIIHIVQAQEQLGFISLDCGLPKNETSPYTETQTGLSFYSDENFIQSGKTDRVQANLESGFLKPYTTLRYFPEGIRNCYNLSVEMGRKYLIKASFLYGNYDGRNIAPVFDLYLGPNLWAKVDLQQVNGTQEEILHTTTSNSLLICLVKTGETKPLISALELRPMRTGIYTTQYGSLKNLFRMYFNKSGSRLRYMKDVYDRSWAPFVMNEWTQISTALEVGNSNAFVLPADALQNAAMPTDSSAPLTITWNLENRDDQCYLYAHFADIQDSQANDTREFDILLNGQHLYGPLVPYKRNVNTISSGSGITCKGGGCNLELIRTNRSTLPPLINAFEVYTVILFPQSETDESDVGAIKNITSSYGLSRINWQGDPCFPQQLRWDALSCSNKNMSMAPRITSLNLSSSGLNGTIAAAIQSLTQLETLDLSYNNLTGEVPEFLGKMKSLSVINLSGNNLNGSIPQSLRRKRLKLYLEGNPRLIKQPKKKFPVAIVSSVPVAIVASVVIVVLFLVLRKRNSTIVEGIHLPPRTSTENDTFANKKSKRFTYSEVIKMTKNFQRVLGKGGFGMVYHGTVKGSEQVAVKVSQLSTQGYKQFKAEVDLLLRVHHTNLVSLVGYCYEGNHLALIYEFLPNGDLKQHLSGKGGISIINWSTRLRIALEAALGLEYLHIGCTPPMVHRDVKTANILLDENFKAKLADFGLSRSFGGESQESSAIAGTHGYLDPEYYRTGRLAEKSDVYSFGIVLLEMITNQPVINQTSENCHITQWVGFQINGANILEIMDPKLPKDYDINSAWAALDLAMSCADSSSSKRPSMSEVIQVLKKCIACENSGIRNNRGLEKT
ncbi:Protein kinase domain [Arabidopsis thaliana x Arabidopsis arenosa]|uniref:Protein kinase domain n=1 Tax=Arabidopsis thaliana x Arabidopsis arenosa TaxID=1240361 RepID=A0A8T1XUM8_9BRAS|nr:Protein kinase domain [Arabidopsis thaliana x Arabidopsis arenosa]